MAPINQATNLRLQSYALQKSISRFYSLCYSLHGELSFLSLYKQTIL